VLSGLVLAGANRPDAPGRDILTADAIVGLDLRGLYWLLVLPRRTKASARRRTRKVRRRSRSPVFRQAFGIDVGLWQHAAAKQDGNPLGSDLVGLGLATVDGFPVEGVSEDSSLSPAGR
jgi:hypothetical protein